MENFRIENGILVEYTGDETVVRVPRGVRVVENGALARLKRVEEIVLPPSVKEIRHGAFMHCAALREVRLPRGLKKMGEAVFAGCLSLRRVALPHGLTLLPADTFRGCAALEEVSLPRGVTYIGDNAFADCVSLAALRLPRRVVRIDIGAFRGCAALREVTLPASLKDINEDAFAGCVSLTRAVFPAALESIDSVFEGCTALEAVVFRRKKPFTVGIGLFSGAPSPLRVEYGGGSEDFLAAVAPHYGALYHVTMGDFARGYRYPMFHRGLGREFVCHVTCLADGKTLTLTGEPYDQIEGPMREENA